MFTGIYILYYVFVKFIIFVALLLYLDLILEGTVNVVLIVGCLWVMHSLVTVWFHH